MLPKPGNKILASNRNPPYRNSSFLQIESHGQGLPHEYIRIVIAQEGSFQLFQLPRIEVCPATSPFHLRLRTVSGFFIRIRECALLVNRIVFLIAIGLVLMTGIYKIIEQFIMATVTIKHINILWRPWQKKKSRLGKHWENYSLLIASLK